MVPLPESISRCSSWANACIPRTCSGRNRRLSIRKRIEKPLWVVKVGGHDGELRPWHYIYVYSIERRLIMRDRYVCLLRIQKNQQSYTNPNTGQGRCGCRCSYLQRGMACSSWTPPPATYGVTSHKWPLATYDVTALSGRLSHLCRVGEALGAAVGSGGWCAAHGHLRAPRGTPSTPREWACE